MSREKRVGDRDLYEMYGYQDLRHFRNNLSKHESVLHRLHIKTEWENGQKVTVYNLTKDQALYFAEHDSVVTTAEELKNKINDLYASPKGKSGASSKKTPSNSALLPSDIQTALMVFMREHFQPTLSTLLKEQIVPLVTPILDRIDALDQRVSALTDYTTFQKEVRDGFTNLKGMLSTLVKYPPRTYEDLSNLRKEAVELELELIKLTPGRKPRGAKGLDTQFLNQLKDKVNFHKVGKLNGPQLFEACYYAEESNKLKRWEIQGRKGGHSVDFPTQFTEMLINAEENKRDPFKTN
jgi:hypothetical protein